MDSFTSTDDLYFSLIRQYLQREKSQEFEESLMATFFRDRNYHLIVFALESGFELTPQIVKNMEKSGSLILYKYLYSQSKLRIHWRVMKYAIISGNIETIKWYREHGGSFSSSACEYAAEYGNLDTLKWLLANGCSWTYYTGILAAVNGHIEILQWGRSQTPPCPWKALTCAEAAGGGHLTLLRWLRENGCPWDERACKFAAIYDHLETLQWCIENGCPYNSETFSKIRVSPRIRNYIDTLRIPF